MSDLDRRQAELEAQLAALPARGRKKSVTEHFAIVPLSLAKRAAAATGNAQVLVYVYLLYLCRYKKTDTVKLTNRDLQLLGISKEVKRRALLNLEAEGLIRVSRSNNRSPEATVLGLEAMP
jgi:CRP-like cAMP-binding protein